MTMTIDLFQLRTHEGQNIKGEILHTMIEHNKLMFNYDDDEDEEEEEEEEEEEDKALMMMRIMIMMMML